MRVDVGRASHFIGHQRCRWGLSSYLDNGYLISSIGEFYSINGVLLYMFNTYYYESRVFKWTGEFCKRDDCLDPLPHFREGSVDWSDLTRRGASTPAEATANHFALVAEWKLK